MSNKTKNSVIKDEATPARLPKLRFPEFREADGWKFIPLNRLAIRAKQKNRDEKIVRVLTNSAEFGVVDQRDFFDKDIATQGKLEGYFVVDLGSYVYNPRISSTAPVGPISKNKIGTGVMSPLYTVFKFKDDRNDFYEHFFKTTGWHTYLRQASSTGARHDRMAISSDDFMAMPLPAPSPAEQQKIAQCLSSVDELIAAQARQVEALKTHKKALMQQLFPREGETQPRLRFPEFQNAGEWIRKPLGNLCIRIMDGTHFSPKSKDGPRPYLTSKNIKEGRIDLSNVSYISEEEHTEIFRKCPVKLHDVLLTKDGANTGNCALNNLDFEFSLLSSVAVLRGDPSELSQEFLFQSILSDSVQSLISESMSGQAITRITLAKIAGFSIPTTSLNEQQRIASCLSSLDALITAEDQKLEAIKTHKKGVMQQLFPSSEVDA